jgi:hypothetical protein
MPLHPVRGLLEHTSPEFRTRLIEVATELGVDPTDLAAVMSFETAGTFSPSIRNPVSNAVGLIQWMPSTAKAFGTTADELAGMSAVEQLDWVKRYFWQYRGRRFTTHELYMLVFWGGTPTPETELGHRDGTGRDAAVYKQNRGLDLNDDGTITAGEASAQVRWLASSARKRPAIVEALPKVGEEPTLPSLPPLPLQDGRYYIVRVGEGPWQVADRHTGHGDRWPELLGCNPGMSRKLRVGQRLRLPEDW